jgi:YHS domain-containing protein
MAAEPGLVRIADPGNICMLSNRYLGEKQHVPVEVEGKTYFGCCAGCAGKLGNTPAARVAVDPVTGRELDKASAVLARDEHGKVSYFESEETFAQARDAR